eukprot:COSAG04_NODE_30010_length_265_cov_0.626506_1_plen_35_part_10
MSNLRQLATPGRDGAELCLRYGCSMEGMGRTVPTS